MVSIRRLFLQIPKLLEAVRDVGDMGALLAARLVLH